MRSQMRFLSQNWFLFLGFCIACGGHQMSSHGSILEPVKMDFLAPLTCTPDEGEPQSFGLIGNGFDETSLPVKGDYVVLQPREEAVVGLRLDICINTAKEEASLKRILKSVPRAGGWTAFTYLEYVPNQIQPDKTLFNAVFGSPESMKLTFADQNVAGLGVMLMGVTDKDGKKGVLFSRFDTAQNDPLQVLPLESSSGKLYAGTVVVGEILAGDPFAPKFTLNRKSITVDSLKIDLTYTYSGSPGRYLTYNFKSVLIEDHNPQLKKPLSFRLTAEPEITANVQVIFSHHGLNDSFSFVFPEVTYLMRNSGTGVSLEAKYTDSTTAPIEVQLNCTHVHLCGKDF